MSAYQFASGLADEILIRRFGTRTQKTALDTLPSINLTQKDLQKFVVNYRERSASRDLKLVDGALVVQRGDEQIPVRITSPDEVALPPERPGGDAVQLRYFPPSHGAPAHFEPLVTDLHLDYNDGPHDPPGANKPEWAAYVGDYSMDQWGKPLYPIKSPSKERLFVHRHCSLDRGARAGFVLHLMWGGSRFQGGSSPLGKHPAAPSEQGVAGSLEEALTLLSLLFAGGAHEGLPITVLHPPQQGVLRAPIPNSQAEPYCAARDRQRRSPRRRT